MNYVGHGRYECEDHNGIHFEVSREELLIALEEIDKFEGTYYRQTTGDLCPIEEVYANDVRYELLISEIEDSGWRDLEMSDDLIRAFEIVMECSMAKARDYYLANYTLIER